MKKIFLVLLIIGIVFLAGCTSPEPVYSDEEPILSGDTSNSEKTIIEVQSLDL